MLSSDNQVKSS